jgi:catechol 2,3-dioxygenase-like lactoylglutathione lyase family enzyme
MVNSQAKYLVIALVVAITVRPAKPQAANSRPRPDVAVGPTLINTCLITDNVDQLVQFYESILNRKAQRSGEDYAEFHTGATVLAIFSAAAQQRYIPDSAEAANNKTAILEFKVADVDKEYARLQKVVRTWVKPPTNQPWGTRSIYFRDPDGNLVDFYAPAKPQ